MLEKNIIGWSLIKTNLSVNMNVFICINLELTSIIQKALNKQGSTDKNTC